MSSGATEMAEVDFQFLAENSVDVLCRAGTDRVIRYISPSCQRQLGWTPEEMGGEVLDRFVFADDLHLMEAGVARAVSPGVMYACETIRMRRRDGALVWMEVNGRVIRNAEGEALEFVAVLRDITDRKLLEERLAAMAMTDGLTGLGNRRAFDEALEREWRRTLREGRQMSLLLLDIDHFKKFNDLNGHQVGDDCLCAVAKAVQGAVRSTDIVARYGGEEIAVVLPLTDGQGAAKIAEKVRAAIEALGLMHATNAEGGGVVTASVGAATAMAVLGGSMRMPESLLLAADHALYKAKHEGRNRVATRMLIAEGGPVESCEAVHASA